MPVLPLLLLVLMRTPLQDASAERARADCTEWHQCREAALEAATRQDYEAFHDLAWRAVQKGPPQNPSLMYMLARAQSLSGRPHDALVMLLRLAERGIETDAAESDDFASVRRLPQWPDLLARLRGAAAPGTATAAPVDASGSPAPPSAAAGGGGPEGLNASASAGVVTPARGMPAVEDALRVPALAIAPIALAHDRASGRFVFGDATGRKLVIVDERMHFVVDLVREASAGFYDIAAFEIDSRRGDLWVVSADRATGATALHHVQMVSGRPLERIDIPEDLTPGRFTDVAVTPEGIVYVLDAAGPRLFSLPQRGRALALAARLDMQAPSSLAPADDGIVYVAHQGGVSRVDTRTGRVLPVRAPDGDLPAFTRIRWNAGALLGVEQLADRTCRILRVRIEPATGRARPPQVVASGVAMPVPSAIAVSDNTVYFVSREDAAPGGGPGETIVKRIPLGTR
jgi:hypothetical protein